ncbi:hypothetical protein HanIR_Chr17g0866031 [Helianthus annuus]|nr:hypothetical protein HanIR_Chr17g0866031 [Helianthus annuus]
MCFYVSVFGSCQISQHIKTVGYGGAWVGGMVRHMEYGAPKTKSQFLRGMVGRGWGGMAKPHHNEVPPWLVLLANEVPPCHVGSPAQCPG